MGERIARFLFRDRFNWFDVLAWVTVGAAIEDVWLRITILLGLALFSVAAQSVLEPNKKEQTK